MTHENQRYFGDWVRFYGYGDTGYYLGTVFVRYLLQYDEFDQIIQYRIHEVDRKFLTFFKHGILTVALCVCSHIILKGPKVGRN